MNEIQEHLSLAANRLFRGRASTIVGESSPMSKAVDKARGELDTLIKFFDGEGYLPDVHKALRDIIDGLVPFSSNEDVNAAKLDLLEAQLILGDTTYVVGPGGETIKKTCR